MYRGREKPEMAHFSSPRRFRLVPYEYYKYILEQMLRHMDDTNLEFMDDLLPWSDAVQEKCSAPEIPKPEEMKPESA